MTKKNFFIVRLLILVVLLLSVLAFSWCQREMVFGLVQRWALFVESGVEQHLLVYAFGYVALYILDSVFALPIASLLGFLAGRFFGVALGFFLSMLGMIIGALLAFVAVRYFVGDYFQKLYGAHLVRFNQVFNQYGKLFLIFIRFIPLIPFSLVNILAAFTSIGVFSFFVTTCVGMAPLLLFLVFLGHYSADLAMLNLQQSLIWFSLAGVAGGLLIFLLKKYRTVLC